MISEPSTGKKIGEYVRYQREKNKYSINELAKKANFAPSFLLRLERGDYHTIKFDIIEKISEVFHIPIEDLLMKCGIISNTKFIYPLEYYFKETYQFPEQAIEDLKMFITLLKEKYKDDIAALQKAHDEYWADKK